MRLIVDSNQIDPLCKVVVEIKDVLKDHELVLGMTNFAELLKEPFRPEKLLALRHLNWRFAKEPPFYLELEKNGSPPQIRQFSGLYERNSNSHQIMMQLIAKPSDLARKVAADQLAVMTELIRQAAMKYFAKIDSPLAQNKTIAIRDLIKAQSKFKTFDDLKEFALGCLSSRIGNVQPLEKRRMSLLLNPHTRHYIFSSVAHLCAQYGLWANPDFNRRFQADAPNDKRMNDYIDMMLVAYAEPGDVVLTADRHTRNMGKIATNGEVELEPLEEFLKRP